MTSHSDLPSWLARPQPAATAGPSTPSLAPELLLSPVLELIQGDVGAVRHAGCCLQPLGPQLLQVKKKKGKLYRNAAPQMGVVDRSGIHMSVLAAPASAVG